MTSTKQKHTGCPNKNLIKSSSSQILFIFHILWFTKPVTVTVVKFNLQFATVFILLKTKSIYDRKLFSQRAQIQCRHGLSLGYDPGHVHKNFQSTFDQIFNSTPDINL
jgi:hypothetical protein